MKLEISNKKDTFFFLFKGMKQNAYLWKFKTTVLNNSWKENKTTKL